MTDAPSDNSFIDDAQPENDLRLGKMADALGCTSKLIQETWQMLGIDSFDDPHELSSVQEAVDIYLSAGKHAARLSEMLSLLPEAEVERLTVERNDVVKSSIVSAKNLSEELLALHAQNRFDQLRPNLCLKETRVTADKNQIKLSVFVTRFVTVHQNSTGNTLGNPLVLGS